MTSKTLSPAQLARYGPDDGLCSNPKCRKVCGPDDRYPGNRKCKECVKKYQRERWVKATPEQRALDRVRTRHSQRKTKYGITQQQYEERVAAQDGRCAICSVEAPLCVDHDHSCCGGGKTCGKCIRELLCADCNKMLGFAHDSVERLEAAVAYLRRFKP